MPTLSRIIAATLLSFFLLTFTHGADAQRQSQKLFNAQYYTLENGLEIVVIPNHRAPVITHMVWYKVGAADEPTGKSGIAHFLEHLMFKGSLGFGPGEFSKTIRALGGNDNAFTSQDYTAYFQSIAAEHLELVMRMEAGRMRDMHPAPEHVLSERDVILEERRQRIDNDPQAQFAQPMDMALFPNHPYGTPVIGWANEMAQLSAIDAKTFYDQHYGPNNAILIVTGDVTGEQIYDLAKQIYGPLPRIKTPARTRTTALPLMADHYINMTHPNIQQPLIQIDMRAPSTHQDRQTSLALQVLENIMGGGASSRLYKALVVENKIASSINFYYNSDALDDGQISIYITPLPGITTDDITTALFNEINNVITQGVTEEEIKDSITRLQNQALYALDSLSGPAMIVGRTLTTGSSLDDIEYWARDIASVTKSDIDTAARNILDRTKNRAVIGTLNPITTQAQGE